VQTAEGVEWSETISESMVWAFFRAMQRFDYKQSQVDYTLFIEHSSGGKVTTLIVYVDDIVMTKNNDEIWNLKIFLHMNLK